MTNGSQQYPPFINEVIPPLPKKSNNKLWIVLSIAALLSIILWGVCFVVEKNKVAAEKAQIEFVLDNFMKYMSVKDIKNAYALFSPQAQQSQTILYLQKWREGSDNLFIGYESLSLRELVFTTVANSNRDIPQNNVITAYANISYKGGRLGVISVAMEKVGDVWRMQASPIIFAQIP